MIIVWITGQLFIALGFIMLGSDIVNAIDNGHFHAEELGALWFRIDASSLNVIQALIQRYIWPELWDPAITTVLLWPAWLVLIGIGATLFLPPFLCSRSRNLKSAP